MITVIVLASQLCLHWRQSTKGFTLGLSPILGNSSEPLSIDVYTSNSSVPLQSISISGAPTYPSVHPYITIAYVTSSPSRSVGGVQSSLITVLGACPVSSSILTPTNSLMPSSLSSSALQLSSYLLPTTPLLNATPTSPRSESATFAILCMIITCSSRFDISQ